MSGGLFGDAAQPAPAAGAQNGRAKYGIYDEKLDPGATVADARRRLVATSNMPQDARAYVNGDPVGEDQVIPGGAIVTFMKRSGEKGEK